MKYFFTFAPIVPATLPISTASQGGSFETEHTSFKDNTPPMPLSDAHLGGLFFLGHE